MGLVAVSPGHYPARPGAATDELVEHTEAVDWVDMIVGELTGLGTTAIAVEPGKLPAKVRFINSHKPKFDLAIELHFNSAPGRVGSGSETLYCPGSDAGYDWAVAIQRTMVPFCSPNRGVKEGWYRMDKPGHKDYAGDVEGDEVIDYFLRKTNCPAVIIEPYFLHEHARIIANRDVVCQVLAEVIHDKLENMGD